MKKYDFTRETTISTGTLYHRIRAVRDFGNIHAGDLGGWIEQEGNLSHDGTAWVADEAKVSGSARVYEDAQVLGTTEVSDRAKIHGSALVDCSFVADDAEVFDCAVLLDGIDRDAPEMDGPAEKSPDDGKSRVVAAEILCRIWQETAHGRMTHEKIPPRRISHPVEGVCFHASGNKSSYASEKKRRLQHRSVTRLLFE